MKYLTLFTFLMIACGSSNTPTETFETSTSEISNADEDYFYIKYSINGEEKEKKKTYKTERVKAIYLKSLNDNPAPAVSIHFPVFTESFSLTLQAEKPGTYKLPFVDMHKWDMAFSMGVVENGESFQRAFEADDVTVTIESIELKADPNAKNNFGASADGFANIKGTFKGTFFMENRGKDYRMDPMGEKKGEKVEVSGEFMSGGNF